MSFSQQVLTEFIENCKQNDRIKARLVLDHYDRIDESVQKRILYELNKNDDHFALPLMMFISVRHDGVIERHPMLVESIRERIKRSPLVFRNELQSRSEDQEAYIGLSARLDLKETIPWLIQILSSSEDSTLQKTAIESLGDLKAEGAVELMINSLRSDHAQLVDPAIDALGKIANRKALEELNNLLVSRKAHVRNRAKYLLVEIGKTAADLVARNLQSNDVDLLIHSLNILQAIADADSVKAVRSLINSEPTDANVRFAAYEALAKLPLRKGDYVLAAGLTDTDDTIRLAAARAIDLHLDESLLRGIKNMLISEDDEAHRISKAVLDSQAEQLTVGLLDNPFFKQFIIRYISGTRDNNLQQFYLDLLQSYGHATIADEIEKSREQVDNTLVKRKICAIDDSRMILKVYQSVLNELSYEPVLFNKPKEFLTWLLNNKPDFIFTDLNMPEITGIDLTREVRKRYSKEELPIAMVTTQNEQTDIDNARKVGVNEIILKPFDIESIKSILDSFLTTDHS